MNRCVAIGCTTTIRRGMLMCGWHWHQVPKPIQTNVHRTWRAVLRNKGIESRRAYDAAVKAAIDAVYTYQAGIKGSPNPPI